VLEDFEGLEPDQILYPIPKNRYEGRTIRDRYEDSTISDITYGTSISTLDDSMTEVEELRVSTMRWLPFVSPGDIHERRVDSTTSLVAPSRQDSLESKFPISNPVSRFPP